MWCVKSMNALAWSICRRLRIFCLVPLLFSSCIYTWATSKHIHTIPNSPHVLCKTCIYIICMQHLPCWNISRVMSWREDKQNEIKYADPLLLANLHFQTSSGNVSGIYINHCLTKSCKIISTFYFLSSEWIMNVRMGNLHLKSCPQHLRSANLFLTKDPSILW